MDPYGKPHALNLKQGLVKGEAERGFAYGLPDLHSDFMEVGQSQSSINSPAERAVGAGIQILRIAGGLLVVFYLLEGLVALFGLELRNPASELRFTATMADRIPMGVLGLGLLFLHPRFFRIKAERVILMILAWLPLAMAVAYVLMIPISMNAAARLFQISSYNLTAQAEEQVKKVRTVLDTTLRLSEGEQQNMVNRYNAANPKKTPVELSAFIQNLRDEVQAQEVKLNQERQAVLSQQKKSLYGSQLGQLIRSGIGVAALLMLWKATEWARPNGQKRLGQSLAGSSRR
ncbi:MAG: hypothetical protein EB056_00275 [Verrucomicrobia bacterium]|nr:hypothetical protein [Verrucomicrobiota bacterium]